MSAVSFILALPVYSGPALEARGFPVYLVTEGQFLVRSGYPGVSYRDRFPRAGSRTERPGGPEPPPPPQAPAPASITVSPPGGEVEVVVGTTQFEHRQGKPPSYSAFDREVIEEVEVYFQFPVSDAPAPPLEKPPATAGGPEAAPEAMTPVRSEVKETEAMLRTETPAIGQPGDDRGPEAEVASLPLDISKGSAEAETGTDTALTAAAEPEQNLAFPTSGSPERGLVQSPGQDSVLSDAAVAPGPGPEGLFEVADVPPVPVIAPPQTVPEEAASTVVEAVAEVQAAPAAPFPLPLLEAAATVEEPAHPAKSASMLEAILTPEQNTMPSPGKYMDGLDVLLSGAGETTAEKADDVTAAGGIPLPVRRDIRVEVVFKSGEAGLSFAFLKKNHPMTDEAQAHRRRVEDIGKNAVEETSEMKDGTYSKSFSLAEAEKGVYAFIIGNNGGGSAVMDVKFTLAGGAKAKAREYKGVRAGPGGKVKFLFLMPETLFWDEDFYTGIIEGPDSVTKFNDVTGLIWKETYDE